MSRFVLDLFAGCGGLSRGLEMAGFEVAAANDIAEAAAQTHSRNHQGSRFVLGSISESEVRSELLNDPRLQDCEIVAGGPPCQAYSLAGKRDVDDLRGHLFEDYVEIVAELRPKIFVMENVKGILSMRHDREDLSKGDRAALASVKELEREQRELRLRRKQNKNTERIEFGASDARRLDELSKIVGDLRHETARLRQSVPERIVTRFSELGYRVEYRLLNAADYGVPQRRERVIFIGSRLKGPIQFPEPTHAERTDSADLFTRTLRPWQTTEEAIGDLVDHPEDIPWSHEFTAHKATFVERLRATPVGGSVYEGYSDAWYRQPPGEPSRTVKENHGGVFVHYSQPRVMTPRELARLQSFPDDFIFSGSKSKVLVQIGNAVPPLLGKAVGQSVWEMLDGERVSPRKVNAGHKRERLSA